MLRYCPPLALVGDGLDSSSYAQKLRLPTWPSLVSRGKGPHSCAVGVEVLASSSPFSDASAWGKEGAAGIYSLARTEVWASTFVGRIGVGHLRVYV